MKNCFVVCVVVLLSVVSLRAQLHASDWGIGASWAMPSGLASSVFSGEGQTMGQLGFGFSGGSCISMLLSQSFELQAGVGFGSVSYSASSGTVPESKSTVSILAGVKSYMRAAEDVSPFIGGAISYTMPPTQKGGTTETSASMLMINAFFGAQTFVSKHFAFFAQIGLGWNKATLTSTTNGNEVSGGVSTLSLGGTAAGFNIYWQ